MKQGERGELSAAWWKNAQPKGLRTAGRLEDALRRWQDAARDVARGGDLDALEEGVEALDQVAIANDAVIAEAAKARDNPEMAATAACLGKLGREIGSEKKRLEKLESDTEARIFATPQTYRAYLLTGLKRLHGGTPMNFALVLGHALEEHRMALHKSKSAKSLVSMLVRETKLHKATWGTTKGDADGGRTMVLTPEGTVLPGMAKQTTLMLRGLRPLPIKKARLAGEDDDDGDDDDDR